MIITSSTKVAAITRLAFYATVIAAPLIMVAFVPVATGQDRPSFLALLSDNFALLGFSIISIQFVLAAGLKWVERPFGLDIVLRFHRAMAVFAGVLLVLHPLLMAAGGEMELFTRLSVRWPIQVGRLAALALITTIVISLYRQALKLSFERWRRYHNALALTLLTAGFIHSMFAGDDLKSATMRTIWSALAIIALISYAYHRLVRPRVGADYEVAAVYQETQDVWTIDLRRTDAQPIPAFVPGQFHFLTLYRRGQPVEEHPFSISSSPADRSVISSTVKEVGDFTRAVKHAQPGDRARVRGPYGRFSHAFHADAWDLVFIAGGIGITPFMSMLRQMHADRAWQSTVLLYSNRKENDIVFRSELDAMARESEGNLRVVNVLSKPDGHWAGERGRINHGLIVRHAGNLAQKHVYLCGPATMIKEVGLLLANDPAPPARVHSELFAL